MAALEFVELSVRVRIPLATLTSPRYLSRTFDFM